MSHDDNYTTAQMLKRLQRQVSRLRDTEDTESVTIFQNAIDAAETSESVEWGDWSLEFDDPSDAIEFAQTPSLDITGDISIAVTAKLTGSLGTDESDWSNLVGKPTSDGQYGVRIDHEGTIWFYLRKADGVESVSGGTIPTDGEVFTVVCTHDTTSGMTRIYLDETEVAADNLHTGALSHMDGQVFISSAVAGREFTGVIDRVFIDAREWALNDVGQYHTGAPVPTGSRRLELQFGTGDGTTALDTSGYNNHGSFVGTPEWVAPLTWERNLGFVWGVSQWSHQSW